MSTILYLTQIEFGAGSRSTLARTLSELKVSRPLLVNDHGVVTALKGIRRRLD